MTKGIIQCDKMELFSNPECHMALTLICYLDCTSSSIAFRKGKRGALVGMSPYLLGCVYRAMFPRVPLLEEGLIRLDG